MVIGNGMIAKRFESYTADGQVIIFASGVSNSRTIDEKAYDREIELLHQVAEKTEEKILVYFSTCSMYDPEEENSRYVAHKKLAEDIIRAKCRHYHIFRVSNVVGKSTNPNTVLNFFVYHISTKTNFHLWTNTTRNLIDIDDTYKIANHIIRQRQFKNQTVNIANAVNYTTLEIVTAIETLWHINANYIPIAKGHPFTIDISPVLPILEELGIEFEKNYLINLLRKYYYHK